MSGERAPHTPELIEVSKVEHHSERSRAQEKEPTAEKLRPNEVRSEVAEALSKAEVASAAAEKATETPNEVSHHTISVKQKKAAYTHTMASIQKEMTPSSRVFSKIIHQPIVEDVSEVMGKTIARPTSILFGSICAFVVMLVVYLLAKFNGFRLSGSEFIVLFAVGWAIGLLADLCRITFMNKR